MPYASSWTPSDRRAAAGQTLGERGAEQVGLDDRVDLETDRVADLLPDGRRLTQSSLAIADPAGEHRQLEGLGQRGSGLAPRRLGDGFGGVRDR